MNPPRAFHAMARAIGARPIATLVLLALAMVPLLLAAGRVRPANSLDAWFVEGDPALAQYHDFLRRFGNDEAVIVGFETPDGARGATALALQRRLATRIASVQGVARVIAGGELPAPVARGLVADDGRAVALVAWMSAQPDFESHRGRIIAAIRDAARAELEPLGRRAHLAGNGVLYEGLNQQTARDTGLFLGLAVFAMIVLLALGLRSPLAILLALVGPLVASAAAVGLMELAGRPFTVVSSALPTLVLVIALADSIHVLLHYEQVRRGAPPADDAERREQAAAAIAWVAVPCFFTALTTAAGFLALVTSKTALVRDFGLFAAAGMMLAWAVTLAFLAAALSRWDVRPPARGAGGGWLQRVLLRYAEAVPRVRWRVLGITALITVVLALGAQRIEVETLTIGLLPPDHDVRRDSDWLEDRLGPYTPLEMLVTNRGGDSTAFAARLAEWSRRAEALPDVDRTFSVADRSYVADGGRTVRVTAYVPMTTANGFARIAGALEREGEAVFGESAAVRASGYLPLYVRISDYVVESTLAGLGSSFLLVFALIAVLLRNVRGVLASVPTNVLPVLLVFGVMGWLGIPLDIATATVGTIVLGIVVDDTIHYLHRYRHERGEGRSSTSAAAVSLTEAGESIVLTTAVLVCGFAVMIAAGTKSISWFGLIATVAIGGAMLADLVLMPVLLSFGDRPDASGRLPSAPSQADATAVTEGADAR